MINIKKMSKQRLDFLMMYLQPAITASLMVLVLEVLRNAPTNDNILNLTYMFLAYEFMFIWVIVLRENLPDERDIIDIKVAIHDNNQSEGI